MKYLSGEEEGKVLPGHIGCRRTHELSGQECPRGGEYRLRAIAVVHARGVAVRKLGPDSVNSLGTLFLTIFGSFEF